MSEYERHASHAEDLRIHAILDHIEADVQKDGWALVAAQPLRDEMDGDGFTYTIGLHKRHLPEIITDGLCGCSDAVVGILVRRQLQAGPYEDGQITQIGGTPVRMTAWPHTGHLTLLTEYYRRFSDAPRMLMARALD